MDSFHWSPGDWLIYRKGKQSVSPGRRAKNVMPASRGESYSYTVDKYWVVVEVEDDGELLVQTRRGKQHRIPADAPQVRKPSFWERFLFRARFLKIQSDIELTT